MLPPAMTDSIKLGKSGKVAVLTPTVSTESWISAGLYAFKLKMGCCGSDVRPLSPALLSAVPLVRFTYVNSREPQRRGLALLYRLLKTRAVASPIANAPVTKAHDADACKASTICP